MAKSAKLYLKKAYNAHVKASMLRNELYFMELKEVLDSIGIPSVYYSFNGYSEDAVCIEYNNNCWMVYNGERGNKYNINKYDNIQDASFNMILRLSESDKEREHIQNIFENRLKRYKYPIQRTLNDTGSLEVRIAISTKRIQELTEYLKENPKDYYSRRRLLKMRGHRHRLLEYLKKTDIERYRSLIVKLESKRLSKTERRV